MYNRGMNKNKNTLCHFVMNSMREYINILFILALFIIILLIASLCIHRSHPWATDQLNIMINAFISAALVFILIESAIAYRNHKKFINIKEQCYKSLNKFSEFFIKSIIDRFLDYRQTRAEEFDRILNRDLNKFLNNEVKARKYFVRSDNPSFPDSKFYYDYGDKFTSRDYNFEKIEEIFNKYILEFDKENAELLNVLFVLIRSMHELEINIGYAERFHMDSFDKNINSLNQVIDECVNIYNLTK